jgi:hypothetical protein
MYFEDLVDAGHGQDRLDALLESGQFQCPLLLAQQPVDVFREVLKVGIDEADVDAARRLQPGAPGGLDPAVRRVMDGDTLGSGGPARRSRSRWRRGCRR